MSSITESENECMPTVWSLDALLTWFLHQVKFFCFVRESQVKLNQHTALSARMKNWGCVDPLNTGI